MLFIAALLDFSEFSSDTNDQKYFQEQITTLS